MKLAAPIGQPIGEAGVAVADGQVQLVASSAARLPRGNRSELDGNPNELLSGSAAESQTKPLSPVTCPATMRAPADMPEAA